MDAWCCKNPQYIIAFQTEIQTLRSCANQDTPHTVRNVGKGAHIHRFTYAQTLWTKVIEYFSPM